MRKALLLLAFFLTACSQPPAASPPVINSGPGSSSTPTAIASSEAATPKALDTDLALGADVVSLSKAPYLVWQAAIGEGLASPALLVGKQVVAASEQAVSAFESNNGAEIWKVTPEGGVWPRSLTHDNERIYAGVPGGLLAIKASDGQVLWRANLVGEVLWPPLVSDALFVGTAFVGPGIAPEPRGRAWIYALDPQTGEQIWAAETEVYTLTTPAAGPDLVYIGGSFLGEEDVEEGGHLRLHAFDNQDGTLVWSVDSLDGFMKSLAAGGSQLYYLAYSDVVVALDAATGVESWRYSTENWSPGFTYSNGRLFFGSDNAFVHAVNSDGGSIDWRVHLEGVFNAPRGRPTLMGDCILFQSNDNRLYCLHQKDGSLIWQTAPQPRSRAALAAADDHIFLSGQDGVLYAYNTK